MRREAPAQAAPVETAIGVRAEIVALPLREIGRQARTPHGTNLGKLIRRFTLRARNGAPDVDVIDRDRQARCGCIAHKARGQAERHEAKCERWAINDRDSKAQRLVREQFVQQLGGNGRLRCSRGCGFVALRGRGDGGAQGLDLPAGVGGEARGHTREGAGGPLA